MDQEQRDRGCPSYFCEEIVLRALKYDYCSDFLRFTNEQLGNCFTFNAAVPGKEPRYVVRGGTGSGKLLHFWLDI